jgi:DNA-binding NarL/FixJ family response regulator
MKYSNVKKEVGAIMGGKILDYPAKQFRRQGQQDKLIEQIQKKLAKGKSIEEIADALEESIETIKSIIDTLQ